ncbi:MAG: exodeoxyribonuclease [Bradyrhizobium sp.]|nr:exodeoxyribonuclease [Bradyrhizobium sp.]
MKIATFNINNINRRLPNLLQWLHQAKPDVVALQELKSTDDDFPLSAINKAGYGAVCADKRPGTASPSWRATPSRC